MIFQTVVGWSKHKAILRINKFVDVICGWSLEVVRPEVVSPLRDAVGLVDHEVGQLAELDQLLEDALERGKWNFK